MGAMTTTAGGAVALDRAQALRLRLHSLLLGPDEPGAGAARSVADVVTWFGAMQAQDVASGLWSLGLRLPGRRRVDVEAALERREALRTWPMRGTVHLVPSRDAHWMLDLMGERALAGAAKRREFLGLDEAVAERAVDVLGDVLAGGRRLTRAECLAALEQGGVGPAGQRGYHLLWYASQRGVTAIAPHVDGEQTFVLLDEWVPDPVRMDRDEALRTIAERFVRSHGPVTRKDLAGWTGLPLRDVDRGVEMLGREVVRLDVQGTPMLATAAALERLPDLSPTVPVRVPPGFDEYLLGYKDRSLMLTPEQHRAVVPGGNGVFQATVVRAGKVVAIWKRVARPSGTVITVQPLTALAARDRRRVERAFEPYAVFVGVPVEVRWAP
jgi:hypothetical protein